MKFLISNKSDGTMKLNGSEEVLGNRARFLFKHSIDPMRVVFGQLVNKAEVKVVTNKMMGMGVPETDGLVTREKGIWLSITVADCLPIVIYGEEVVTLLHGGWRGIEGGIVEEGLKKIRNELGIKERLKAYIGPSIKEHHYPVGREVAEKFGGYEGAVKKREGRYCLDLQSVVRQKMRCWGIEEVEVDKECTFCAEDKFFSARRDRVDPIEAMMVLVRI